MHMNVGRTLARWFPVPETLLPKSAGVDISDTSVKWITLEASGSGYRIAAYGSERLEPGIVEQGTVRDAEALGKALADIRGRLGATAAHAALPEEGAYIFSMRVPRESPREQIRNMLEFELEGRVPLALSQVVYDLDIIPDASPDEQEQEVGVVAFPEELAAGYAAAFDAAGIELLSLEIEARSIGRALWSPADSPQSDIVLMADFGRARTGIAILKRGVPIFTSTVEVGGDTMMRVVMEELSLSQTDAEEYRNKEGLLARDSAHPATARAIEAVAASLADEIARHYQFWDTRRGGKGERVTPIGKIVLVGGSANLKGLADYVAGRIHAKTERPNVWTNVCSFDEYIPPIPRRISLQYATAIGLALRGV